MERELSPIILTTRLILQPERVLSRAKRFEELWSVAEERVIE
jgi:hypothetical protein